jgi:hypothetical protein
MIPNFATFHPDLLGDLAYAGLSESMSITGELRDASWLAPTEFQKQMRPKDPLERLAHTQILMAHARTAWLSQLATRQKDVKALAIILEACDRASSVFAKLMRATSEYREPKSPTTTVSIGQANVADQQFVQNVRNLHPRENNEQTRMEKKGAIDAEVVPLVKKGIAIAASNGPKKPTVDQKLGTKECSRKSQGRHERVTARRAVGGHRHPAKTGERND